MRSLSISTFVMLTAAGCASQPGGAATTPSATQSSSGTAGMAGTPRTLVASLQPLNNAGNRLLGTLRLVPNGTEYRVDFQIRNGGGPQNKFPWAIRPGGCGDDSRDVIGNELAYRVLETTADGTARLNTSLRLQISEGVHHVNVLKGTSGADRETIVACGILAPG